MKNFGVKVVMMSMIFALTVVGASAQRGGGRPQGGAQKEQKSPEKIAEIKTDKMDQELELTDAQEKKIYEINLKAAKEMTAQKESRKGEAKPQERPSKEQMEAKIKEMKEKKDSYIKSIMSLLNDDQKISYAMMIAREEMKHQMHRKGSKGGQQQGPQGEQGKPQGRPQQQQCE
ncbi:MAG: DUF4890 domain-containing protein [Rikenellaceae bacterium]